MKFKNEKKNFTRMVFVDEKILGMAIVAIVFPYLFTQIA